MATTKPTQPDFASMTQDELNEFIAQANKVRAEKELAEATERRKAALATVMQLIDGMPATVAEAKTHAEAGDISQTIAALARLVTAANDAKKAAGQAGRTTGTKVTRTTGNGGTRESAIRDEILAVFAAAPAGTWFSPTELSHEMPDGPTGNPRSSGAILSALEGMVRNGQAEENDGRPRKFRAVQASE